MEHVNSILSLPHYAIVDSNRYGFNNLLRLELKSLDSSLVMFISIKTYEHDTASMGEFHDRFESRRQSMGASIINNEFLIIDTIVKSNKTEVGLLKYFDKIKNRYEGLIFFFKDFKMVEISLYADSRWKEDGNILDCIFNSLRIN
ncbi:MAG: hypothetical protein ACXWV0_03620 [Flavisolibacter sp.]